MPTYNLTTHHRPLLSRTSVTFTVLLLIILFLANATVLSSETARSLIFAQWLPSVTGPSEQKVGSQRWRKAQEPVPLREVDDDHPIRELMHEADRLFDEYEANRSKTFKEAVEKYKRNYGRLPPPSFNEWYKFARKKKVHNIDDFQQIHDDLRPFWAIPPALIRQYAAHASDDPGHSITTVSLRNGQAFHPKLGWRSETFVTLLKKVAPWLPDMDIPMNRMDQPRVLVPWEHMQAMLQVEEATRPNLSNLDSVEGQFTKGMSGFFIPRPQYRAPSWWSPWNPFEFPKVDHVSTEQDPAPEYGWFPHHGLQYMDLVAEACPPESYARNANSTAHYDSAEASYKCPEGGFITNSNLSSDLCIVGPTIKDLHGLLYASSSMLATHTLVPVFGECKINVNNDILFPANMYWKRDPRYEYDEQADVSWDDKKDVMIWRGVTSGGLTLTGDEFTWRWRNMHRQRLVLGTNSTELERGRNVSSVLTLDQASPSSKYNIAYDFEPAAFAKQHTDVGFTEKTACVPTCDFYNSSLAMLSQTTFSDTFASKYLVDVDGMSFSGRWRAFLQSRSLGLKSTIFREWHDSRLWAWRHFVPVDNRYDDLWALLTYFIGVRPDDPSGVYVPRHDFDAMTLASQGRQWAAKVLRREDMEIYVFRLLLEYGRLIDDNRDRIGLVGDGGMEMEEFDRQYPPED